MTSAPGTHFTPWTLRPQPCWHCRSFVALDRAAALARCSLLGGPRVRSQPQLGCSAFEREPGADDDADGPTATVELQFVPKAPKTTECGARLIGGPA